MTFLTKIVSTIKVKKLLLLLSLRISYCRFNLHNNYCKNISTVREYLLCTSNTSCTVLSFICTMYLHECCKFVTQKNKEVIL